MCGTAIGIVSDIDTQWETFGRGPKFSSLTIKEPLFPHNGGYIWWQPCQTDT